MKTAPSAIAKENSKMSLWKSKESRMGPEYFFLIAVVGGIISAVLTYWY
tara:strand:+ start:170 stop:316 length:147 start_codon:yes stop_codon:yes gene_type:complete